MTSDILDRAIASLQAHHDDLARLVPTLTDEQLTGPSGAAEWTIAQVLSHLGSGAEIGRLPIATAAGQPVEREDNASIWARWDAAPPREQATAYVEHDRRLLDTLEALTPEQRESLSVDLGFLPAPVPLVVAVGMRLNEVALHAWDVHVGLDPQARLDADAAELLLELFAGDLAFLLGFSAHADRLGRDAVVAIPGGAILVTEAVSVTTGAAEASATLEGPAEAAVRLLSGRLRAPYDAGVAVTGDVTLDELRAVFPGY